MQTAFRRYLTEGEEKQLFKHLASSSSIYARRDLAWMKLLRQTGIRVGALNGLNVHDARQALATDYLELRPEIMKRNQGHTVHVTKKARQALKDLLKIRKEMGYADSPDEPLICSRKHQRMSVRSFEARTRHWCEQAGLNVRATPHWFRHSLGKRIVSNSTARDPRGIVQSILGHKSASSTDCYLRADRSDVEKAMKEAG